MHLPSSEVPERRACAWEGECPCEELCRSGSAGDGVWGVKRSESWKNVVVLGD